MNLDTVTVTDFTKYWLEHGFDAASARALLGIGEAVSATPNPIDLGILVSLGKMPGIVSFRLFGHNPAVGAGAYELIGTTGAATPYLPTAATQLEAISTSANDTAAGSGARTIRISGLDGNFREIEEDLTMAGLGVTASTSRSFIRVLQIRVITCGTYGGANAGVITVRAAGGGTTFDQIDTQEGHNHTASYTVPSGKTLLIADMHITVETTKAVNIVVYSRENADDVTSPFTPTFETENYTGVTNAVDFEFSAGPVRYNEKTDLYVLGQSLAGTSGVSFQVIGTMFDNAIYDL